LSFAYGIENPIFEKAFEISVAAYEHPQTQSAGWATIQGGFTC